jgi:hypothetical protein
LITDERSDNKYDWKWVKRQKDEADMNRSRREQEALNDKQRKKDNFMEFRRRDSQRIIEKLDIPEPKTFKLVRPVTAVNPITKNQEMLRVNFPRSSIRALQKNAENLTKAEFY